jgi:hypothetical protein
MWPQAHSVSCTYPLELSNGIRSKGYRVLFWYFEDAVLHFKPTFTVSAQTLCDVECFILCIIQLLGITRTMPPTT